MNEASKKVHGASPKKRPSTINKVSEKNQVN